MIDDLQPSGWREFQEWTAGILRECGVSAEVDRVVETARGAVNADIWACDHDEKPVQTYLIECKHWRSRVPKTIVHAFRTFVADSGANGGAIVAASGFQKGAFVAAQHSNVRLLTWVEFQQLFEKRWFERQFLGLIANSSDAFMEYTEQVNGRIDTAAEKLPPGRLARFRELRRRYAALSEFVSLFRPAGSFLACTPDLSTRLPLRGHTNVRDQAASRLSEKVLDASSLRSLLQIILQEVEEATAEFDVVFGERA